MSKVTYVISGVALLLAVAIAAQAALPIPVSTLAVNKQLKRGPWTVTVTGDLTVDRDTQTVVGTLTAVVTDRQGNVVATAEATFNVVAGSGTVTLKLSIPAIGVDVDLTIDIASGTVEAFLVDTHAGKLRW